MMVNCRVEIYGCDDRRERAGFPEAEKMRGIPDEPLAIVEAIF